MIGLQFLLYMIQNFEIIKAHGRSEIAKISFQSELSQSIVSIANDGNLKVWDKNNLKNKGSTSFKESYLTSLKTSSKTYLVGTGSGKLTLMDPKTHKTISSLKIHDDCITDIFQKQHSILTVGMDGRFCQISKKNYQVTELMKSDHPINQLVQHRNKMFLAGISSFEVDQSLAVKKLGRIQQFLSANNRLYGTNDEKGFFIFPKKSHSYIPCQSMVQVKERILGTSWSTITIFSVGEGQRIFCKSQRCNLFDAESSIKTLICENNTVFGGSQLGKIYKFDIDDSYNWLS